MIRFINLKGQMYPNGTEPSFSFYSTITDTFYNFNGSQYCDSWEEFEESYNEEANDENWKEDQSLERFKRLVPVDFFNAPVNKSLGEIPRLGTQKIRNKI